MHAFILNMIVVASPRIINILWNTVLKTYHTNALAKSISSEIIIILSLILHIYLIKCGSCQQLYYAYTSILLNTCGVCLLTALYTSKKKIYTGTTCTHTKNKRQKIRKENVFEMFLHSRTTKEIPYNIMIVITRFSSFISSVVCIVREMPLRCCCCRCWCGSWAMVRVRHSFSLHQMHKQYTYIHTYFSLFLSFGLV